ncbi:hypothetical protein OSTOST_15857 [Ostertagia ostertagi]
MIHFIPQPRVLASNYLSEPSERSELENESTVVAWFVDIYRRYLSEEPFQEELGSFLGLLEDSAMLSEVERRLVGRIHAQLKDYIQLEEMREKDKSKKKETTPKGSPQDLQF